MAAGIPHSEFLRWDPDDQALALAWRRIQAATCPRCGTSEWDWQHGRFQAVLVRCKGCEKLDVRIDGLSKATSRAGLKVRLEPEGD